MASRRSTRQLAHLWQLPLLLLSLGLFAWAAWLFINPRPAVTAEQKIQVARVYVQHDRPKAAIELLNRTLANDKLSNPQRAQVHLLLAESLELGQRLYRINIAANHRQIIDHTLWAIDAGAKADADVHRRLAESYEAMNQPTQALWHLRQAMGVSPARNLPMRRKIIELQLAQGDRPGAAQSIEEFLKRQELTDAERAWATGQQARILIDRNNYTEARPLLEQGLKLAVSDAMEQGQLRYWLGYCAWKLSEPQEAQRHLRAARDQLTIKHPVDADACYLLGRIHQDAGDHATALSYYDTVLTSHPDAKCAPLARLNRGVCRLALARTEDSAPGLTDLHDIVNQVNQKEGLLARIRADVLEGLQRSAQVLVAKENFEGALEVMGYEQQLLQPDPPAQFFARLAPIYDQRASQIEKQAADARPADRPRRDREVRDLRRKAGDSHLAYARAMVLPDDKAHGEALWKAIQLYNQAGDVQRVTAALQIFVAERPDDPQAPEAMLQLGQAYRASGQLDKAIAVYQQNQFRYPNSLSASKSAVPLAQAYISKGPDYYRKAETVLRAVVENNPVLTPEAQEFRLSLFELAQLYYRTERYEEAIARLEEMAQRYPDDQRMSHLVFLMADSYRKSAAALDARAARSLDAAQASLDQAEAQRARKDRLARAKGLYDKLIDLARSSPPQQEMDKLHLKLSYFYRADCTYDLGDYQEAIKLYDAAAFQYQEDPSALAAYVQIVNANCALGRVEEAKAANERAKWMLDHMPRQSFEGQAFTMPKAYWEQWLKWSSNAGMWW